MRGEGPAWEELNAYGAGELDPEAAARVARAVAADAETANAVAALARLKAVTPEVPGAQPEISIVRPRRLPLRRIAASLAALVVVGGAALYAFWPTPSVDPWMSAARAAHQGWAATKLADIERPSAAFFLTAARRMGPQAFIPDLTAAKLSVARIRHVPGDGQRAEGLHVGYAGTRGCRISLWITPVGADGPGEGLSRVMENGGAVYSWNTRKFTYVLMAAGMEGSRFSLISRAAYRATRARAAPTSGMRSALRASREASAPCPG